VSGHGRLFNFGDFLVEVGEGGLERSAMIGVLGGFEVVDYASARQLQILALFFAPHLIIALRTRTWVFVRALICFDLRFDCLALPTSRHIDILTHPRLLRVLDLEKSFGCATQALAARRFGTGKRWLITPRRADSATRARCSAKMP